MGGGKGAMEFGTDGRVFLDVRPVTVVSLWCLPAKTKEIISSGLFRRAADQGRMQGLFRNQEPGWEMHRCIDISILFIRTHYSYISVCIDLFSHLTPRMAIPRPTETKPPETTSLQRLQS